MFRYLTGALMIAFASICLVACNPQPEANSNTAKRLGRSSASASASNSPQIDLSDAPFELNYDTDDGWVEQSKTNPAVWNLFSRYRGSLYEITAVVLDVRNPPRFQTRSITDRRDIVLFQIAPADSIPGHPESRTARLAYDAYNSGLEFERGKRYIIAFTKAGTIVDFWPANREVVPGWWYPQWWGNPNDEPWNDHRPKQPPGFVLIRSRSNNLP